MWRVLPIGILAVVIFWPSGHKVSPVARAGVNAWPTSAERPTPASLHSFVPQGPFVARASESLAYVLQGDVGVNVRAALNANNGRIRLFAIQPGETWSFGHTIAPISALGDLPVVCGPAGCFDGGGWCDLAWMYMSVAQQLGLRTQFPQHIGVGRPFPGILIDENGNGGDLFITNVTGQSITFIATEDNGTLTVSAG